ncbi:MAG: histidine ammonia-lyase [Theionarchaea archaeon]|nr:histidine ammonia-lyase [Theionarchaea archaeon]MBU7039127.1 histidine ammonia-lyase [Theionarchaea archaeon]
MDKKVEIDGEHLTIEQVMDVARHHWIVILNHAARNKMEGSEKAVQKIVEKDEPVYGINTGFGPLRDTKIDRDKVGQLQVNLIRSHSVGTGDPFPEEVVRAAMVIRANTIAKGCSGARPVVAETLLKMLNQEVTPFVPEKGSVGASGDLAPLSHLALVMIGEGEACYKGEKMPGQEGMEKAGIAPLKLKAKEGLAINNGATFSAGMAALAVSDAEALLKNAVLAAALSFEAFKATSKAFDERIHQLRPHKGQIEIAKHIRDLTRRSRIIDSMEKKVQDDYSVRCFPQVLGASFDAVKYVRQVVETEINSATDNPLIIDDHAISGGNFHGQPLALAMDFLGIAVSEIGDISERHLAKLMDNHHSDGLPIFLIPEGKEGLNSGPMMVQYTAASLVSENKVLSHPACVDSIPTSANAEDHVSMSTIAARKAREILSNVEAIIGIELLSAAQAVDLRRNEGYTPDDLGEGSRVVYTAVREHIPALTEDRYLYPDLEAARGLVHERNLIEKTRQYWKGNK